MRGISGAVYLANENEFKPRKQTFAEQGENLNQVLDKLFAYCDDQTGSKHQPIWNREVRLRLCMDKLREDLVQFDQHGVGDIAALSIHLLLSTQYRLLTLKESRTLLDYVVHQLQPEGHSSEYAFHPSSATGQRILDNKTFMEQKIRTSFFLALIEKCFQIRL